MRVFYKAQGSCTPQTIKVGDVVLIHDDTSKSTWRITVIKDLTKENDGYVRAAEVRTSNGRTNQPLSEFYPLEISTDKDSSGTELKKNTTKDDDHSLMMQRKTKNSATKAKHKLCQCSKELMGLPPKDVEN